MLRSAEVQILHSMGTVGITKIKSEIASGKRCVRRHLRFTKASVLDETTTYSFLCVAFSQNEWIVGSTPALHCTALHLVRDSCTATTALGSQQLQSAAAVTCAQAASTLPRVQKSVGRPFLLGGRCS